MKKSQKKERNLIREEKIKLIESYGGRCICCGSTENVHVDHIKSKKHGGKLTADNAQPLCMACNIFKADREIDFRSHPMRGRIIPGPTISFSVRVHVGICAEINKLAISKGADVSGWIGIAICNQMRADGADLSPEIEAGVTAFAKKRPSAPPQKKMVAALAGVVQRTSSGYRQEYACLRGGQKRKPGSHSAPLAGLFGPLEDWPSIF